MITLLSIVQLSAVERSLADSAQRYSVLESDLQESQSEVEDLHSQLVTANESLVDLHNGRGLLEEVSKERLDEITSLTRQLEEERVKGGLVKELGEQIASLEDQLHDLQNKVQTRILMTVVYPIINVLNTTAVNASICIKHFGKWPIVFVPPAM